MQRLVGSCIATQLQRTHRQFGNLLGVRYNLMSGKEKSRPQLWVGTCIDRECISYTWLV